MCLIFLLIIMQRMVTSSTAAVRQSLERRLAMLEGGGTQQRHMNETDIGETDIEDGDEAAFEAPSLNDRSEIAELQDLVNLAQRAELQYQDAKVEALFDTLDAVLAEGSRKVIIFTEFMATQDYLKRLLERRGFTVSILNGSMSIDERNAVTEEFRTKTDVFVSTDAGGEGLNLQFASVVINYDMPWNPMRIEQRCGRVDRIGQTRDVEVYNFMIDDTVESRVHEVIEEKLSVILDELGIDKYSDVLDSEACDLDFTNAYMGSIGKPQAVERSVGRIEKELREQVSNVASYQEIIREDKDLGDLVGVESDYDVTAALGRAFAHYSAWRGGKAALPLGLALDSPDAEKLLHASVVQDRSADVLSVEIEDFPTRMAGHAVGALHRRRPTLDARGARVRERQAGAAAHRGQAHHGCLASARREAYRGDCFERRCRDVGPVGGAEPGLRLQRLQGPLRAPREGDQGEPRQVRLRA